MEKKTTTEKNLHHTEKANFYPHLVIKNNLHPDSLYAFPFVGMLIKLVLLIPAAIFLFFIGLAFAVTWFINSFVILFSGKYWNTAYEMVTGYMIYKTKLALFLMGLTDRYPGFNLETNGIFEFELQRPASPSRLMAFPFGGALGRSILLIPYSFYRSFLGSGALAATVASWFAILTKGKYPDSLYEFNRDSLRVSLGYTAYLANLSDTYPSFWMSFKHKSVKITLIIIGVILTLLTSANNQQHKAPPHRLNNPPMQHQPLHPVKNIHPES